MPGLPTPDCCLVGQATIEQMMALARLTPSEGCFVEVGVYQGGSAQHLHALAWEQSRLLYLYDTFKGMPHYSKEDGDNHPLGDFADTSYEAVRPRVPYALMVQGIFPQSAIPMPPIAFAHVDVDNYQCVIETGRYLAQHMCRGGIIWFDDSPCLAGAKKATFELFGDSLELSLTGQHFVRL